MSGFFKSVSKAVSTMFINNFDLQQMLERDQYALSYVFDKYITNEICEEVVERESYALLFVPS